MLRKACGSFVLMKAGDKPGDPEVEESYSLDGLFQWLRDCPEQIHRGVFIGDRVAVETISTSALGSTIERKLLLVSGRLVQTGSHMPPVKLR
jgi:hypothetical protein